MTNKEAITYLEWLSNIDFSKKYPKYPMVTKTEQVEALKMAITALQAQDIDEKIGYMERLNGGGNYRDAFAALSEKVNNSNDQLNNSNVTKDNSIKDCISRQAAIDALAEQMPKPYTPDGSHPADEGIFAAQEIYADCIQTLEALPSAQPEVIRCKDCKHSEHWYRDKRRCFLWNEVGIDVFEDGFCNYAERREDG